MTDNHLSYKNAAAVAEVIDALEAKHRFIKPHCPWQNGKVERFNRTLQIEWAYRQVFSSSTERCQALATWRPSTPSGRRSRTRGCTFRRASGPGRNR